MFRKATDVYNQSRLIQDVVGVGRYNWETWIYSHPDVVPCDFRGTTFRTDMSDQPRFNCEMAGHEWSRMHGRLFEFYQLYHKLPSNDSFFLEVL